MAPSRVPIYYRIVSTFGTCNETLGTTNLKDKLCTQGHNIDPIFNPPLCTHLSAGYYAVQYSERLRIISLNTQYCDNLNFWLYLNNRDPADMLSWLVGQLSWAEVAGVKVIILGHIPTGRIDCMKAFSWNYYRIIDRLVLRCFIRSHKDIVLLSYLEC